MFLLNPWLALVSLLITPLMFWFTAVEVGPAVVTDIGVGMNRFASLAGMVLSAVFCVAASAAGGKTGDWPMWGGSPDRNMVSAETGLPASWDAKTKKNVKWVAPLGTTTYGAPVISNGRIFVGTNNGGNLRPGLEGDKGVLVCLDEKTGRFLWQATHDKLPSGSINDWPEQGIVSAPWVDGDRLYYVSNQCQLVCADV